MNVAGAVPLLGLTALWAVLSVNDANRVRQESILANDALVEHIPLAEHPSLEAVLIDSQGGCDATEESVRGFCEKEQPKFQEVFRFEHPRLKLSYE